MGNKIAVLEVKVERLEGLNSKVDELVKGQVSQTAELKSLTMVVNQVHTALIAPRASDVDTAPIEISGPHPTVPSRNKTIAVGGGAVVGGGLLYAILEALIRTIP